jgi:phage gpG-like protein
MRIVLTGDAREKLKEVRAVVSDERRTVSRMIGIEVVKGVQRNIRRGRDASGRAYKPLKLRSGTPLRDKGLYLNSWTYALRPGGVRVGTNKIQGPIQNYGGTIRPKRGKYLAVPVGGGSIRLVKSVVIPAREHAYVSDETEAAIQRQFDALLRRAAS